MNEGLMPQNEGLKLHQVLSEGLKRHEEEMFKTIEKILFEAKQSNEKEESCEISLKQILIGKDKWTTIMVRNIPNR